MSGREMSDGTGDGKAFLGTGWSFPPTFTRNGSDVLLVSGVEDIEQSLAILLSTHRGERIMQEDFGGDLSEFLFAEVSHGLAGAITAFVTDVVTIHEPRVVVNEVDVSESDTQAGLLLIRLDYTVRATNTRYNMVYPFYLNEAVAPL